MQMVILIHLCVDVFDLVIIQSMYRKLIIYVFHQLVEFLSSYVEEA